MDDLATPLPPLPKYNINRILKLKAKLSKAIELEYHGFTHTAEAFDVFVNHVSSLLPGVRRDVVYESMRVYAGIPLLDKQLKDLAWRLAGNLGRLKEGKPVYPWSTLPEDEWVPVQVRSVHKYRYRWKNDAKNFGRHGAAYKLLVLGGYPAGHEFEKEMSDGTTFFHRVDLGMDKYGNDPTDIYHEPKERYPLVDVTELTSMRFMVWLTGKLCIPEFNFDTLQCPASMRKWNRDLTKRRNRKNFNCPFGYQLPEHPCYKCAKGYSTCPVACHPVNYVKMHCTKCGKERYCDPARPGQVCVPCLNNMMKEN